MFQFKIRRCVVAEYRVDFRKSHYGLLGEAKQNGLNLYLGDMVIFVSKNKKRIKAIFGDDTGLTIIDKVFSYGSLKTGIRFLDDRQVREISLAELGMLLEGTSYTINKVSKKWLPQEVLVD
jgi:hypothetical protein